MSTAQLKSLAERIERLMDERDGIQSDIRDIYTEAKSAGYVPKVLRKAITRKRMDPSKRDEEDAVLELYEGALSGPQRRAVAMAAQGASSREIEQETGLDHATVARSVALNKKSETRSPVTRTSDSTEPVVPTGNEGRAGERTESNAAPRGRVDNASVAIPEASRSASGTSQAGCVGALTVKSAPDGGGAGTGTKSCGGVESRHASEDATGSGETNAACNEPERVIGKPVEAGVAPGPQDLSCPKAPEASSTVIARAPAPPATDADVMAALDSAESNWMALRRTA